MMKDLAFFYTLEPEDTSTRLRIEAHFHPRAFLGTLLAPLLRLKMKTILNRFLEGLRSFCDGVPGSVEDG